ncbi:MAG: hypothetical protein ACPGTO_11915 [Polaribacter sp.]
MNSKTRLYIDNSVIGGYYDEIFQDETRSFFKRIENKEFQIYFSDINETELFLAPQKVKDIKNKIPLDCLYLIEQNEESKELGDKYIETGILTIKSLNDAYHIAIASVNRVDLLVSWSR